MKLTQLSCKDFAHELASKKPVPGGGGAASLTAALGAALNTMVVNYTTGKKKFIAYEEKYRDIIRRGEILRDNLIELVDKDAENFEPLSKAYALPETTEEEKREKEEVMQKCLKMACTAPMEILEFTYDSILLHNELVDISSKTMISDIGVGVQCLKSALFSGYLNILINIKSISDKKYVLEIKDRANNIVEDGSRMADEIYDKVLKIINE